jgi:hypothetical protein
MRFASYASTIVAALMLGALTFAAPVFAQTGGSGSSPKQLDIAAARAERKAIVGENMGLTPDEGKVFWPLYEEYESAMDKIEDRHIREIRKYVKSLGSLTNDDATQKLDEVMSIHKARLDVQNLYIPKFRAAMSSIKVTRFFQIDSKLRAMVQCDIARMVPLAQPTGGSDTGTSF